MTLDELIASGAVEVQYRLKNRGTLRKEWKRHKCFSYSRIYEIIGDCTQQEAERVIRAMFRGYEERTNVQVQFVPGGRILYVYWQQPQ